MNPAERSSHRLALLVVSSGGALVAGAASDRLGRRPLLIGGLLAQAISGIGVAVSGDYAQVADWRAFGGLAILTFGLGLVGSLQCPVPSMRTRLIVAPSGDS